MDYTINRSFNGVSFEDITARTREALTKQGFAVLTEIDVKATMKKKIDADMDGYLILGACNPGMAFKAIEAEPRIGAMLPCNVIIRQTGKNSVEVSAVDPVASMQAVENAALGAVAGPVKGMLQTVIDTI